MLQAWCMREFDPAPADGPMAAIERVAGTSTATPRWSPPIASSPTIGTCGSATYPSRRESLESVSDEKLTALGPGFFLTVRMEFEVDGEPVAAMRFPYPAISARAAKRKRKPPSTNRSAARVPRLNEDNRFFFDGVDRGELLIRSCANCGRDQHPPLPMCPACGALAWAERAVAGEGTVYTFTVTSHPQFPGFDSPFVVALVELSCGARLVTNLVDVDPLEVRVGLPVEVVYEAVDDELTLPLFRPASGDTTTVGAA